MGHSGVCGASYIVEVLNIVCANSQQHAHTTRMFKKGYGTHVDICKHFVPHYCMVYKLHSNVMEYALYIMVCWSMHCWHSACI